jgi:hypothetical protein
MVSWEGELFRRDVPTKQSDEIQGNSGKHSAVAGEFPAKFPPHGGYFRPGNSLWIFNDGSIFRSDLVTGRRKQISAASDGADYRGFGRVGFDFAPDSHDPQIDGAIEGLTVAGVGQFQ